MYLLQTETAFLSDSMYTLDLESPISAFLETSPGSSVGRALGF